MPLPKRDPGYSFDAMGKAPQELGGLPRCAGTLPRADTQLLSRRFRVAYAQWKEWTNGTQSLFADALGETGRRVRGWFESDPARPVPEDIVVRAESLAVEARLSCLSDQEIAAAVRRKAAADAAWERIRLRLIDAA